MPSVRIMKTQRKLVSAIAFVGIALGATFIAASPASAADIGTGRAIIRIDAAKATATPKGSAKEGVQTYTLTLPSGSKGQWLGERKDSRGKERLRVGNLTAKQLSSNWEAFRYTGSGVLATLAWDTQTSPETGALVRLSKPKVTDKGVVFSLTTPYQVPKSLKDVTLSLQRAPQKSTRTSYVAQKTVTLTGALTVFAGFTGQTTGDVRLYNAGNDNTCWSHSFGGASTADIPDGRCDDVSHTAGNSSLKAAYDSNEYFQDEAGYDIWFVSTLQPDGEAAFNYNAIIINYYQDYW